MKPQADWHMYVAIGIGVGIWLGLGFLYIITNVRRKKDETS